MKIKMLLPLLAMGPLILSGCASSNNIKPQINEVKPEVNALDELRDISIEARHELRILAKMQEAKHLEEATAAQHEQRFLQATYIPADFDKLVTFTYTGPASKTAQAISSLAKYKLVIEGAKPAIEPWVRINLDNQPLNEALKEIGMQTGEKVRVEVHESARIIRFIYQ